MMLGNSGVDQNAGIERVLRSEANDRAICSRELRPCGFQRWPSIERERPPFDESVNA